MVPSGPGIGGSLRPEPAGPPLAASDIVLGRGDRVIVAGLERFEQAPLSAVDLGRRPLPLRRRLLWLLPAVLRCRPDRNLRGPRFQRQDGERSDHRKELRWRGRGNVPARGTVIEISSSTCSVAPPDSASACRRVRPPRSRCSGVPRSWLRADDQTCQQTVRFFRPASARRSGSGRPSRTRPTGPRTSRFRVPTEGPPCLADRS